MLLGCVVFIGVTYTLGTVLCVIVNGIEFGNI